MFASIQISPSKSGHPSTNSCAMDQRRVPSGGYEVPAWTQWPIGTIGLIVAIGYFCLVWATRLPASARFGAARRRHSGAIALGQLLRRGFRESPRTATR